MADTIQTTFDPFSLPTWTRKHSEVVALCERDLAYRCDVFATRTTAGCKLLVVIAQRRAAAVYVDDDEHVGDWCQATAGGNC